jgi:hypothetical protein
MQVIILAGSFGTRLQAVVPDLPKPMGPRGASPASSRPDHNKRGGMKQQSLSPKL